MTTYSVNYLLDGYPSSIQRNNISIPIDDKNNDFQEFLAWNAEQSEPLDWQSPQSVSLSRQHEILFAAVQAHMNTTAQSHGYDSADRCASYAASTNPTWSAEAAAFVAWRDACWAYVFGLIPPYPTAAELLAALPGMEWPR